MIDVDLPAISSAGWFGCVHFESDVPLSKTCCIFLLHEIINYERNFLALFRENCFCGLLKVWKVFSDSWVVFDSLACSPIIFLSNYRKHAKNMYQILNIL